MKCICIAGASQIGLFNVADILAKAGMMPPLPSNRADFIDIQSWHEQAFTLAKEEDPVAPGRFMEQLAGDIFSANTKANLWGWADTRSTWLLDFWLGFDPRLCFVLVYVSPELMLANAIHSKAEFDSVAAIMEDWQAHYQHLLRFHLRNPGRSLIVDASECIENPQAFVNACAKQWKLQIDTSAIHDSISVPQDDMAHYLARQLCMDYPQTASLQHELVATLTRLGEAKQSGGSVLLSAEQIIANFHFLRDKSDELKLLQTAREELSALKANFDAALVNHARDRELVRGQQEKIIQLNLQYETTVASHLQQQNETEQENELLLLQLHQVQEELEHYFLQCQDKQSELQNAERRWQNMLRRNPDYCDYESIEMESADNAGNIAHWRVKNLNNAGQSLPDLAFTTIVELGMAGFVFAGHSASAGLLTRWPVNATNQSELTIIPVGSGEVRQQRYETLLDLAISDWNLLRALTRLLERTLKQTDSDILPTAFDVQPLLSGLIRLEEVIENFPKVLRYDLVSLRNEQVNPDYEHLWLHFDNLALGNKRYQDFEFRLSCGNVRPEHFGAYPKLEFPEVSGQAPFEAWFIEASDDFGAKLELRFALPESIDIDVLYRLVESDRDFLFALITRLPAILATLQNSGIQLKRSWDDWINLANKIEQIYRLRAEKQSAPAAQPLSA
jgi:hypothetical protein